MISISKKISVRSGIECASGQVDGGVKVKRWRPKMMSLSCLTLVVVVAMFLMLALELALSLWKQGKAVEIDLRDLEGLTFGIASEETDSGEARRDTCC
jgi:hypothetical protein